MIDLEKFLYGKCPNCKKYGILRFFRIGGKYSNNECECKHCGEVYRVNPLISIALMMILAVVVVAIIKLGELLFNISASEIPKAVIIILTVIGVIIIDLIAPLEKCD